MFEDDAKPVTESELRREAAEGVEAHRVLSEPAFQKVMAEFRELGYEGFRSVQLEDPRVQEKLLYWRMMINVVEQFEETFKSILAQGSRSARDLEALQEHSESMGRIRSPEMYEH